MRELSDTPDPICTAKCAANNRVQFCERPISTADYTIQVSKCKGAPTLPPYRFSQAVFLELLQARQKHAPCFAVGLLARRVLYPLQYNLQLR